jgi:hypothetical protein
MNVGKENGMGHHERDLAWKISSAGEPELFSVASCIFDSMLLDIT